MWTKSCWNRWTLGVAISLVLLSLAVVRYVEQTSAARAWTTSSYSWVTEPGNSNDGFMNYDGQNPGYSTNVDWPIRFIWTNNAEIDKVKDKIDGCGNDPYLTPQVCLHPGDIALMHLKFKMDNVQYYDNDSGLKRGLHCNYHEHMRFYAHGSSDYWYNATWGYYIVSSLHMDYEWLTVPWDCTKQFWSTEVIDEGFWGQRVTDMNAIISPDWTIYTNTFYFANPETARQVDSSHYVESNAYGASVCVPSTGGPACTPSY